MERLLRRTDQVLTIEPNAMSETTIIRRSPGDRRTGKTDWVRLGNQADAGIERTVAGDADAAPILDKSWFHRAKVMRRGERFGAPSGTD